MEKAGRSALEGEVVSLTGAEVRERAYALGWDDVAITEARIPPGDIADYLSWLERHFHGDLAYMERQMRTDPQALFAGAKSAILFVTNYKQERLPFRRGSGLIASYARGRDYHNLHRGRLRSFIGWMEERTGRAGIAKGFSDSAPVLEKALAVQAGLGWFGKNTLLIHRRFGTFTLLAGLFTTLEFSEVVLAPRLPRCGSCRRCLDACPTGALVAPYTLDARRCLSYHTIESKREIPQEIADRNPGYLFGCDICQEVCPHNVRTPLAPPGPLSSEEGLGPYLEAEEIAAIEKEPALLFGTPLKRRGAKGLRHTLESLQK